MSEFTPPRNMVPVCVVPIGWAKGNDGPTERPPVSEVVHIDRFSPDHP